MLSELYFSAILVRLLDLEFVKRHAKEFQFCWPSRKKTLIFFFPVKNTETLLSDTQMQ